MTTDLALADLINVDPIELDFKHTEIAVVDPGKTKSHVGRPLKLNNAVVKTVVINLATGATLTTAARAAGVARKTFYQWMDVGRDLCNRIDEGEVVTELNPHDHMCLYFYEMIQMAEAGAELQLLQLVLKEGGPGAKWILQRRWPEKWAHKQVQQVQHTGEIKLDWGQPSDVEIVEGEFKEMQEDQVLLADPDNEWAALVRDLG